MNLKIVFIFIGLIISQFFNGEAFSQAIGESDLKDALRKSQSIIDNKIKEIYGSEEIEEIEENNFTRDNYGGINSESNDCNQSNLSQEQLVECEYQKNQNVIGADGDYKDWSSDLTTEQIIQQNEDLDKAEEEKIRSKKMKAMEQKKKAMELKKKAMELKNAKVEKKRALRDPRGKWGINFKMTQNEAINSCLLDSSECAKKELDVSGFEGCSNRHVPVDREFVDFICRKFGPYSSELWAKIEKQLKSKYKLLIPKKSEDLKAVVSLNQSATFFALYKNESNNNEPMYIEINTFYKSQYEEPLSIFVIYHSQEKGEQIIEKYSKKEQIIDDL